MHYKNVDLSFDTIQDSLDLEKWAAVSLIITWVAVNCVKLSFVSLFRELVDRIRPMVLYWWFVLAYTISVALFGISSYIAPYPTFYDFRSCEYTGANWSISLVSEIIYSGLFSWARVMLTLKFSVSQMTLHAPGDILNNGEWILL